MTWFNRKGFTLVEIMIVVAIIGLLAAIAVPNFVKSRETARKNSCINNLRIIDGAKEQAALAENWENGRSLSAADITIVNTYIKGGAPTCPSAGTYTYNAIGTDPQCSKSADGHVLP